MYGEMQESGLTQIIPLICPSAIWGFLLARMLKNLPAVQETQFQPLGPDDPLEKRMVPTPGFLPGEFHGQRSLVGYHPWGRRESDTVERLTLSLFMLSAIWATLLFSRPGCLTTGSDCSLVAARWQAFSPSWAPSPSRHHRWWPRSPVNKVASLFTHPAGNIPFPSV